MSDRTTTRTGLLAAKGSDSVPVPLAGVSIEAEIRSAYAKVVIAQRYVNNEATPIEAVYVFPLDEGAAVCGFEAIVDGTLVIGEVHEREKAFEIYDDAMEQGHGAFLLDEERPDVFQASIGNLPPGKEVLVKLTYVTELAVSDRHAAVHDPDDGLTALCACVGPCRNGTSGFGGAESTGRVDGAIWIESVGPACDAGEDRRH